MSTINDLQAHRLLSAAELRCTPGRLAILSVLLNAHKPLSQQQIQIRLSGEHLDRVTIYRALACFVRVGLVHRAYLQNRTAYYEPPNHCRETQCHPHFTCLKCGSTYCVYGVFLPVVEGLKKGFVVQRQQVRLEGLCPKCSV